MQKDAKEVKEAMALIQWLTFHANDIKRLIRQNQKRILSAPLAASEWTKLG